MAEQASEPADQGAGTAVDQGARLIALARDRSIAGREALAASVASLMAENGDGLKAEETRLAADILRTLIRDVERSVRLALATNLAASAAAPRDVILALANDEADIAFPVLAESPLLDDAALIEIVTSLTSGHRIAVAMRAGLGESVSDALIESDDEEAVVCLLHNPEAAIGKSGLARLVEGARGRPAYRGPLADREELEPDLAFKLATFVSETYQRTLIQKFGLSAEAVERAAADAAKDAAAEIRGDATEDTVPDADGERRKTLIRQMIACLRRGDRPQFEAAMVRFCGLPPRLTHTIIRERDGRRLTVLCRAQAVPKSDFASLFLLSRQATPDVEVVDAVDIQDALTLFDRIPVEAAARAVQRWRRDVARRGGPDDASIH